MTVIVVKQARVSFRIEYSKMISEKKTPDVCFTNRSRKNVVYQA